MTVSRPLIAVVGSRVAPPEVLVAAEAIGRGLAASGLSLICGGRGGVMAAASRGLVEARRAIGPSCPSLVVGVLPGEDASAANVWCDVVLPSGIGIARNLLIVRASVAVVGLHGGSGTLSELAFAWQLGKPVAVLASSGGWSGRLAGTQVDDARDDAVVACSEPESVLAWIHRLDGVAVSDPGSDDSP